MFGLFDLDLSFENIIDHMKEIINDKEEMERLTGNGLSNRENQVVGWWRYLGDDTKFKNVVMEELSYVTFESKNRIFKLEITDNHIYKLTYIYRSGNKYDRSKGQISGDFYKLRDWFKKRNYLK
jgi:hypothetical protein